MTSKPAFKRVAYLVCKWFLLIVLFTPLTNWAQGIWVARKDDRTIYLIPTTHVVAAETQWRDVELDIAIKNAGVAYIENTGIHFDPDDYPKYVVPEYERLSDKAKAKLEDLCTRAQEQFGCYKAWHPFFVYTLMNNLAMSESAAPYEVGFEYHVVKRLGEQRVGMRSLEYPDELFATVSKSSNASIIESVNLLAEASAEDNKNGLARSVRVMLEGGAAMQQSIQALEKNSFSGDFFEHLIIDRTRNMAARMLDDPHKSIIVLSGYAHFFSRKDNFFSLLEDQGFTITKLKAE